MSTPIYLNGLQGFYEANELSGADTSPVSSFTDLSGNSRHLVAASSQPLIKTNAVNSKKSIIWDGTKNPLVHTGTFRINSGFLLVKVDGDFTGTYQGILSTPADWGILTGIGGSNLFYDFLYNFYEFRLNDRIYPQAAAPAPISTFGIIYFRFWQRLLIDGIQLGQDRGFTARKFDGEISLLALYDRDWCESEIRKMFQSIAYSYQLGIENVFPYRGSKSDTGSIGKIVLSDNQPEPVLRVKRGDRKSYDLSFTFRSWMEFRAARAFWELYHPEKTFLYHDYQLIPPESTIFRLPADSEFEDRGASGVTKNYGFSVFESTILSAAEIPLTAPDIPNEADPDITPPSVPTGLAGVAVSGTEIDLTWGASTD